MLAVGTPSLDPCIRNDKGPPSPLSSAIKVKPKTCEWLVNFQSRNANSKWLLGALREVGRQEYARQISSSSAGDKDTMELGRKHPLAPDNNHRARCCCVSTTSFSPIVRVRTSLATRPAPVLRTAAETAHAEPELSGFGSLHMIENTAADTILRHTCHTYVRPVAILWCLELRLFWYSCYSGWSKYGVPVQITSVT
ncbi:hypothetical protein BKA67DRAFT_541142 [Truncatella angustata]|uniref:Uncharacterized protein n=1 Tax=Truncatella angustata TaxID=152316 RepID=A0A9P8RMJ5_9PEZI|nr:uncharacterized protein BKA67DRAFT_541142 [Truncatella angustata]KAH6646155.1 hypothetical protein BKA67DRAFT_541142 [Truncatella angustata]